MPSLRIKKENENSLHFLTLTVVDWIDVFTKKQYFEKIIDSLVYCQKYKGLLISEYVIMTNHLHLMAQAKEGCCLSKVIASFKRYTTSTVLDLLEKDNRRYIFDLLNSSENIKKVNKKQLWRENNYPVWIYSDEFEERKASYIHYNPVKKGYVCNPEDWFYSSARDRFLSIKGKINLSDL